ncbi:MAG TPA: AAA family ATPase [Terracidiphilus sp.]
MAQHPFLKSIKPVNLLSFGPNTEEIELRPLNILIGPNGSGKSNLIEIIRLLHSLPDKDPWASVLETGGIDEWIWKGERGKSTNSSITATVSLEVLQGQMAAGNSRLYEYSIKLAGLHSVFYVNGESVRRVGDRGQGSYSSFVSSGATGESSLPSGVTNGAGTIFSLNPERSILSQLTSRGVQEAQIGVYIHEVFEIGEFFESLDFHQDWEFGVDLTPRDPVPAGQAVERLEENAYNLAQMLTYYRDYHRPIFDRVCELMKHFYEPFKSLEVRVIGTHLQIAIQEEGGFSTSAYRLSDGTLRALAVLTILLNPTPAPVTCIDEPELGLHPDAIHTIADLLIEASARTQLIVTTHSTALVDAFSDNPEAVSVCEKVEGSTQVRRLSKERLSVWLEDYSLGRLWASGEIGGNRW